MNDIFVRRLLAFAFSLSLGAATATAAPSLAPGPCARLVGPGAAMPELFASDVAELGRCTGAFDQGGSIDPANRSVHSWVSEPLAGSASCHVVAWASNAFEVAAAGQVEARISVDGWYAGVLGRRTIYSLKVQVLEEDGASLRVLAEAPVFEAAPIEEIIVNQRFGVQVNARLQPGRIHQVRLLHDAHMGSGNYFEGGDGFDFGLTLGRGAGYDSIEVCLTPVEDLSDVRSGLADVQARLGGLETTAAGIDAKVDELLRRLGETDRDEIEWRLYQKDCLPSLWLPASQGGKLERSRSLVASLIDAAAASSAPGPNLRLARQKLADADASMASGDYQRACWMLSEALRALTTP